MSEAFASGHVIDAILVLMVIEGLVLGVVYARTNRGVPPSQLVYALGAGAALMLALRSALTSSRWEPISACLIAGLVIHLLDLRSRWK
jgi:hypothetical protein